MRKIHTLLSAALCLTMSTAGLLARQDPPAPKYSETELKEEFDSFMEGLDFLKVVQDHPKSMRMLFSGDPERQIEAVRSLTQTGEVEVIPWLLPFLDAEDKDLRIWTGSCLEKLVSSDVLKRRYTSRPESGVVRPRRPEDHDLRPLAWVVLKMFRKPDDGNTHAYAASMTRYLGLREFRSELEGCLESEHPAVSNKAKWALECLERQKEYQAGTSVKSDADDRK